MQQNRIYERQQAIDRVQRRAPVAAVKRKPVALVDDEMIEDAEIDPRRIPFHSPQGIQRHVRPDALEQGRDMVGSGIDSVRIHPFAVVPDHPLQYRPRIGQFAHQYAMGKEGRCLNAIRPPILLPAQQHIAGDRPLDPRQESAVLGKKADGHILVCTKPHEIGLHITRRNK